MTNDNKFIAISLIWYERFLECSRTYMTPEFRNSVWRFYGALLDLGKGDLAVQSLVKKFIDEEWQPKIDKLVYENTINTTDADTIAVERRLIESQYIHEIFNEIKRVIQQSGIGWPTQSDIQNFTLSDE